MIFLGVLSAFGAAAQDTGTEVASRPRVGPALSGGGARGGAHIGVLKVLEEFHVPVDCIAGTSMAAIVFGEKAARAMAAKLAKLSVSVSTPVGTGSMLNHSLFR